jgi:hypothetical protein
MAEIVVFCDVCGTGINLIVGDRISLCKKCGKRVCKDCTEKAAREPQCYCAACVAACSKCGEKRLREELKEIVANGQGRRYCDPCYDKTVKTCAGCGLPFLEAEMTKVGDGVNWEFYCKACVPKDIEVCSKCGANIHGKDIVRKEKALSKTQLLCKGCHGE